MFKYLLENLKDRPDIIVSVLEEQRNMLEYFKSVFDYHNVENIPDDVEIFYLDYPFAKAQAEKGIQKLNELLDKLRRTDVYN